MRSNMSLNSQDSIVPDVRVAPNDMLASVGASLQIAGSVDDEPTCMHTTISCRLGGAEHRVPVAPGVVDRRQPERLGVLARTRTRARPRAALRSISAAAATGSHSGMIISGMKRPGAAPHHSSTIQSL